MVTFSPGTCLPCRGSTTVVSYCGLALPSRELISVAGGRCKVWRHYIPKGPVLRAVEPSPVVLPSPYSAAPGRPLGSWLCWWGRLYSSSVPYFWHVLQCSDLTCPGRKDLSVLGWGRGTGVRSREVGTTVHARTRRRNWDRDIRERQTHHLRLKILPPQKWLLALASHTPPHRGCHLGPETVP